MAEHDLGAPVTNVEDLYEVLQVSPNAEPEIIEAAYRRLARKYHPDVAPGRDSGKRMRRIVLAYEILGDPTRRAEYDALLSLPKRHAPEVAPTPHVTPTVQDRFAWWLSLAALVALALIVLLVAFTPARALVVRGPVMAVVALSVVGLAWYVWHRGRSAR
jgi:hypothetical protein